MRAIVATLKEKDQDFEWYPTTNEILECVKIDMVQHFGDFDGKLKGVDVLDCGAGDGRVLEYLTAGTGNMYAIEKSQVLLTKMAANIFIVGTHFEQSTLIDKKVDMVFCNPPYSQYEMWASKVIAEANAAMVYLVIPNRWKSSATIAHAIKQREASIEVIGCFDFKNAERQARAQVEILAIKLYSRRSHYGNDNKPTVDPFSVWFDNQFTFEADKVKKQESEPEIKETLKEKVRNEVVKGGGVISTLASLYNNEMSILWKNYKAVSSLDPIILYELGVDTGMIQGSLKQKIAGLKNKYWQELFENYHTITSRLTISSRKAMLNTLLKNTVVDFTESNAYAVTIWAIKNANKYYDMQLIQLVDAMIGAANIKLYKSNERTFGKEEWRYCWKPEGLSHFALELRIVLFRHGGINISSYSFEACNGLSNRAHDFLSDICTVANNLGYFCQDRSKDFEWSSGKKNIFSANGTTLMEVRAFKNGNMHIKFNQDFLKKLNVEFGRLKGWLKNKQEASKELEIPLGELDMCFDANFQLKSSDVPQLMAT